MANFNLGQLVWKITTDSAGFVSGLDTSEKKLKTFSDRAQKIGGTLTKFVTVPLLGAAGVAVKFASDLAESTNAVNVVFGESSDIITAWGDNAAEQAGVSKSAFNQAATSIGTLLKKSGEDMDIVAGNTINVTKRAADLASVFNTDVSGALAAAGALFRGETEPARRYGISISEAAVNAKALELGLARTANEITEAAKIQARYTLFMEESAQVAGDFVNTNDGAANSLRVIKAQVTDLAADLGSVLLPIVEDVLGVVREWTDRFSELDEGQQRLIVGIAAVAAAAGPVIVGIGGITKAIQTLNTTALFGPAGVIIGLTAVTAAVAGIIIAKRKLERERLAELFADITTETGLLVEEIQKVASRAAEINRVGLETFEEAVQRLREEFDLTETQVLEILARSKETVGVYGEQAEQILKVREEAEKAAEAEERRLELAKIESQIQDEFLNTLTRIDSLVQSGALTEEQGLERKIELRQQEVDKIIEAAEQGEISAEQAAEQANAQRARLEGYYARLEELRATDAESVVENAETETEAIQEIERLYGGYADTRIQNEVEITDVVENEVEKQKAAILGFIDVTHTAFTSLLSSIDELNNAIADSRIDALDRQLQAELEANGVAEQSAVQKAQAELAAARQANDAEAISEAQTALKKAQIEEEFERKKAKVQYEAALESWKISRDLAVAQMFQSAINAYSSAAAIPYVGFILGPIAAAAALTAGAINVAAVDRSKPSPPAFQQGGIVPGDPRQIDQTAALLTPGEEVLRSDDPRHINNIGRSGITITFNNMINLDSEEGMVRAAQAIYPYLTNERSRRGERS